MHHYLHPDPSLLVHVGEKEGHMEALIPMLDLAGYGSGANNSMPNRLVGRPNLQLSQRTR